MMNLKELAELLKEIDLQAHSYVAKAVNQSLTLRNWAYGYYIKEYELNGKDRAEYGENVVSNLSKLLTSLGVEACSFRQLQLCKQFYSAYPAIVQTASAQLVKILPKISTDQIMQTVSAQSPKENDPRTGRLLENLSFSHFAELLRIDIPLKRTFYEVECVKGSWSVKELRRQIASLYYERSALSKNKEKLSEIEQAKSEHYNPIDIIRDPYVFEFLGVKPHEIILESKLADELLDKLQNFLLELGKGFCFEARNKRILIGDEYFFIDLVFYHRILKCNVIIELKTTKFTHEHIGQLNTYVKYFKKHEMHEGDNPPIGILLCTEKNHALVEYAMDENTSNLFVSKYQLELPTPEEMQKFIEKQLK